MTGGLIIPLDPVDPTVTSAKMTSKAGAYTGDSRPEDEPRADDVASNSLGSFGAPLFAMRSG